MKLLPKIFFILTLLFAFTSSVNAAEYYVSPNGLDTNPGSVTYPWKTIQKGANTAVAGDTVTVIGGNYSAERVSISKSGTSNLPITFQSQGTVVMKGFKILANYIIINGFEIANTDYRRWDRALGSGIYIQGAYNTIKNNYIHDASLVGIYIYGTPADALVSHDNIIQNNKLYQNELIGIDVNGRNNVIDGNEVWATVQCHPNLTAVEGANCPGYSSLGGLDADGMRFFGQGHVFKNNYIHDIRLGYVMNGNIVNVNPHIDCFQTFSNTDFEKASNITFYNNYCNNTDPKMSAFMLEAADHLYIYNNIFITCEGFNAASAGTADYVYIYHNIWANSLSQTDQSATGILFGGTHANITNNIFYNQPNIALGILGGNTANVSVDFNLIYNSNGSIPSCFRWGDYNTCQPAPNHNLWNINPQFTGPASGDYHLKSTSPAIDSGFNIGISTDKDGNSRPIGQGYDIGPFEYTEASNPTPTPPPKSGDADGDGNINYSDMVKWLNGYVKNLSGVTNGDFDGNGKTDGKDYIIWSNNFGK